LFKLVFLHKNEKKKKSKGRDEGKNHRKKAAFYNLTKFGSEMTKLEEFEVFPGFDLIAIVVLIDADKDDEEDDLMFDVGWVEIDSVACFFRDCGRNVFWSKKREALANF
jgi:hypothetical protein